MRTIAVVLSVVLVTTGWCDEPKHAGRTLDEWCELLAVAEGPARAKAADGIAAIAGGAAGGPQDNVYFAELVKLLSDDDSAVRCAGIRGMQTFGKLLAKSDGGQTAALNTLEPLLKDEAAAARIAAARAMLMLEAKPAGPMKVLEAALQHRLASVRKLAATACAEIGPRASGTVPALKIALLDIDAEVRGLAREALSKLEKPVP
jgi:HEAT repeat protein